jgi:hypothetical protein
METHTINVTKSEKFCLKHAIVTYWIPASCKAAFREAQDAIWPSESLPSS